MLRWKIVLCFHCILRPKCKILHGLFFGTMETILENVVCLFFTHPHAKICHLIHCPLSFNRAE